MEYLIGLVSLLEGKTVNLRIAEKEDLPLVTKWYNDPDFNGQYFSPLQRSRVDVEMMIEPGQHESRAFVIQKKDGTEIGLIFFFYALHPMAKTLEISYRLIPSERRKGYCTEAAQIMVDYLFLSKETTCIQATTHSENIDSQKVLQRLGFQKEGTMRKRFYVRGEWQNLTVFSILREEWKEPKILTRNTQ
jgi:RimJ/RimL family protein N-acetyltransferase